MKKIKFYLLNKGEQIIKLSLILVLVLFALYVFSSGLQGDDTLYKFTTSVPMLKNLQNSFLATVEYYFTWNGRFIVNFINIFIVNCGMVIQTIFVCLVVILVMFSLHKSLKIQLPIWVTAPITLFILLMTSQDFLFDISCLNIVCNYFLPIPFELALLNEINKNVEHYSPLSLIKVSLLALICGSLIETYSFPIALYALFMLFTKRLDINWQKILISLFFAIGCLTLLLCPGSLARSNVLSSGFIGLVYRANGIVGCFSDWMIVPLLLAIISSIALKQKNIVFPKVEQQHYIYCALQIFIMCLAPYFPPRALIMVNFILVLTAINKIKYFEISNFYIEGLALISAIALCGQLLIAFGRILFS